MPIERHYTTAELASAEMLNCSTDTILRLAQRGELLSVFLASERRYPESGVEEYLAKRSNARGPVASLVPLRDTRTSTTRRTA